MTRFFTADLIITADRPPLKNAFIETNEEGIILNITENPPPGNIEKFKGIIVPGFINAHCHLELSHFLNLIPEKSGMADFVQGILSMRFNASADEQSLAMKKADQQMYNSGIVAVGDISNLDSTFEVKKNSKIYYHTFVELLGFDPLKAESFFDNAKSQKALFLSDKKNNASIVAHAPYTLSDELFDLIKKSKENISCIHMEESKDEDEFCKFKTGPFAKIFTSFGFDFSSFRSAADKTPLEKVLPKLNHNNNLQFVHNVLTKEEEIAFAESQIENLYWCLCPNANLYITNSLPDFSLFDSEKRKVTVGTDSLASNHQLSILEELKVIQKNSSISMERMIKWATLNAAEFLKIDETYGSIEVGKKPGLVLIENINPETLVINKQTFSRRID